MNDYVPLSSWDGLPSPHSVQPLRRDPWFVWGIAVSPVLTFTAVIVFGASSVPLRVVVVGATILATAAGCVQLARLDRAAIVRLGETRPVSPWVAVFPAVFLLVRAARRAVTPHRGNPLAPLLLNLGLGVGVVYFYLLLLASVAGVVNREINGG